MIDPTLAQALRAYRPHLPVLADPPQAPTRHPVTRAAFLSLAAAWSLTYAVGDDGIREEHLQLAEAAIAAFHGLEEAPTSLVDAAGLLAVAITEAESPTGLHALTALALAGLVVRGRIHVVEAPREGRVREPQHAGRIVLWKPHWTDVLIETSERERYSWPLRDVVFVDLRGRR